CIYADDLYVLANVGFAGAALQALAASHVHFGGNEVTFSYCRDLVTECNDFATKLMPRNKWRMNAPLRPAVPFVDMKVGAADRGDFDFDENVGAPDGWNFDLPNLSSRSGIRLHYC